MAALTLDDVSVAEPQPLSCARRPSFLTYENLVDTVTGDRTALHLPRARE